MRAGSPQRLVPSRQNLSTKVPRSISGTKQASMLFTRITLVVVALAAAPAVAIPPPIFGFPDSDNHTELGVTFTHNDNSTLVQEAMLFGSNSKQEAVSHPPIHPMLVDM